MSDDVEKSEAPSWLLRLEEQREKRLKGKLGHEAGAGAPCQVCGDKCPGLDLHFWRKICKLCKCGKENHDVNDDDIYGFVQFQLLGSKPTKAKSIFLGGKENAITLDWTPKGSNNDVQKYLEKLPEELLPVKGSEAAKIRKQRLQKQLPAHDIDASLCHALSPEEIQQLEEYVAHIRNHSVGQGKIIQFPVLRGEQHKIGPTNPQFFNQHLSSTLSASQPVNLQKSNLSQNLQNLSLKSRSAFLNSQIPNNDNQNLGPKEHIVSDKIIVQNSITGENYAQNPEFSKLVKTNRPHPENPSIVPNFEKVLSPNQNTIQSIQNTSIPPSFSTINPPENAPIPPYSTYPYQTQNSEIPPNFELIPFLEENIANSEKYLSQNPNLSGKILHNPKHPHGKTLHDDVITPRRNMGIVTTHDDIMGQNPPLNYDQGNMEGPYKNLGLGTSQEDTIGSTTGQNQPNLNLVHGKNMENIGNNGRSTYGEGPYRNPGLVTIQEDTIGSRDPFTTGQNQPNLNLAHDKNMENIGNNGRSTYGEGPYKNLGLVKSQEDAMGNKDPFTTGQNQPNLNLALGNVGNNDHPTYGEGPYRNPGLVTSQEDTIGSRDPFTMGQNQPNLNLPPGKAMEAVPIRNLGPKTSQDDIIGIKDPFTPVNNPHGKTMENIPFTQGNVQLPLTMSNVEKHQEQFNNEFPKFKNKNIPTFTAQNQINPYAIDQNISSIGYIRDIEYNVSKLENDDVINSNVSQNVCHKCKNTFSNGDFAVSVDRTTSLWHSNCFNCHTCSQPLADLLYFYHKETDNIYCGRDYAILKGIPRCSACDELIFVREYCLAEQKTFHVKHFCCFECDEPLAGKQYVMENDQPNCFDCYEKLKAEKCNDCGYVIGPDEQGVNLKDLHWHATEKCFACKYCRKGLLGGKMLLRNQNLFCSDICFKTYYA